MLYVLIRRGYTEKILIGAKDKVQMWGRLKELLTKKQTWGNLGDWTLKEELKMADWCCWVLGD